VKPAVRKRRVRVAEQGLEWQVSTPAGGIDVQLPADIVVREQPQLDTQTLGLSLEHPG
jgi:hypothetical protein